MNGMSDRAFLECIDAKFEHVIERLAEAQNAPAAPSTTTTSGVHFHGSAGLSVLSAAAILAAISAVCIVAAWRSADMQALNTLRDDLDVAEAIIMQHEKRINKLEPKP